MAATQGRACRAASSACPLASSTVWSVRPTRRPPSGLDTAILYTRGAPSVCALPPPAGRVPRPRNLLPVHPRTRPRRAPALRLIRKIDPLAGDAPAAAHGRRRGRPCPRRPGCRGLRDRLLGAYLPLLEVPRDTGGGASDTDSRAGCSPGRTARTW